MHYLPFILPALVGGFVQSTTGFGCGIIIMMFYPALLGVLSSATISECASIFLTFSIIIRYRKHANLKKVVLPLVFYFPIYLLFLQIAASINVDFLKPILGLFLIAMSIYFIFAAGKISIKATPKTAFICAALSAMADAFFGIGGPPIVLYFLSTTENKEEYFANVQMMFFTTSTYGALMRIWKGILTPVLVPNIAIAVISIAVGTIFGHRVADRLDGELLKKLVYVLVGVAGMITFITNLDVLFVLF